MAGAGPPKPGESWAPLPPLCVYVCTLTSPRRLGRGQELLRAPQSDGAALGSSRAGGGRGRSAAAVRPAARTPGRRALAPPPPSPPSCPRTDLKTLRKAEELAREKRKRQTSEERNGKEQRAQIWNVCAVISKDLSSTGKKQRLWSPALRRGTLRSDCSPVTPRCSPGQPRELFQSGFCLSTCRQNSSYPQRARHLLNEGNVNKGIVRHRSYGVFRTYVPKCIWFYRSMRKAVMPF
ncbi:uncharacterized protein LOC120613647 [Pteropus medius]|uniref:uncharacterized protein LOC120613647 n=1 Tax=Pteropus vampyrus TaxID=132908 RepID=UPI00196B7939|nr:uncharacterized protein LOC120613647 [Pteropus giganteus]